MNANPQHVLIVGSGIAGMCAALALGEQGNKVTVLERDVPPPAGDADQAFFEWNRRGAAQFRHPHAFLGLMCNLLQDRYPKLLERFYAAGARRLEFRDTLSHELEDRYRPEPGDERLWMLLCRRATIETELRRFVTEMPNIEIHDRVTVEGMITEDTADGLAVRGVRLRRDSAERLGRDRITADVVIDASGRASKFPRWFADLGKPVREENDDAEIVYYTRHYRLNPGEQEPARGGKHRAAGDLGYIKYGVFPGDNGNFAIIVCCHVSETELREAIKDPEQFDAICRSIPGLAPWVDPAKVKPTTDSFGIGEIRAIWRHYVDGGEPLALNFFAVGDASLRTNPLYGRGCSTSILHALTLTDIFADTADPRERALRFAERTEADLRPIFATSLREDKSGIRRALAVANGELLDRPDSFKKWFGMAFGDALAAAARNNLHVMRGVSRTMNLLEKPGAFLEDWRTRLIIIAYMFRGRSKNAAARMQVGPSRDEMLAMVRRWPERAAA